MTAASDQSSKKTSGDVDADVFFSPWEGEPIESWPDLEQAINDIVEVAKAQRDVIVWRGHRDAKYSLSSTLYRELFDELGRAPLESDVVEAEKKILERSRGSWRFDNLSTLELFAQIQHYEGVSRLLDVTFNPLVAAWFAVESDSDKDARIIAIDASGDRRIDLADGWAGRDLPWENPEKEIEWCTGRPYLWRPPSYNQRIAAQNAAFLVGGVPNATNTHTSEYRKEPGTGRTGSWSIDETREFESVKLPLHKVGRNLRSQAKFTFSYRIAASAKKPIREMLEQRYGFSSGSIYPDYFGLAKYSHDIIK